MPMISADRGDDHYRSLAWSPPIGTNKNADRRLDLDAS
jgi:hypothetical protein